MGLCLNIFLSSTTSTNVDIFIQLQFLHHVIVDFFIDEIKYHSSNDNFSGSTDSGCFYSIVERLLKEKVIDDIYSTALSV